MVDITLKAESNLNRWRYGDLWVVSCLLWC